MNISVYAKRRSLKKFLSVLVVLLILSCKNDEPQYVYVVDKQLVTDAGAEKPNVKSSTEYIAIAHSDALGSAISNKLLSDLKNIYIAFGDKGVTENVIIKNFLAAPQTEVPNQVEMRADIDAFIVQAYRQIFNRPPTGYEAWYLKSLIEENDTLQPKVIYYALMTSNEYRQF